MRLKFAKSSTKLWRPPHERFSRRSPNEINFKTLVIKTCIVGVRHFVYSSFANSQRIMLIDGPLLHFERLNLLIFFSYGTEIRHRCSTSSSVSRKHNFCSLRSWQSFCVTGTEQVGSSEFITICSPTQTSDYV